MEKFRLCRELYLIIIKTELYTSTKTEDIYIDLNEVKNHIETCQTCQTELKKQLNNYIKSLSFINANILNQILKI